MEEAECDGDVLGWGVVAVEEASEEGFEMALTSKIGKDGVLAWIEVDGSVGVEREAVVHFDVQEICRLCYEAAGLLANTEEGWG